MTDTHQQEREMDDGGLCRISVFYSRQEIGSLLPVLRETVLKYSSYWSTASPVLAPAGTRYGL
eukprot:COSAG01_NODE_258_length_20077_cov_124.162429_19_plen_63_part_00